LEQNGPKYEEGPNLNPHLWMELWKTLHFRSGKNGGKAQKT
jgi:hypothetical protein